MRAGTDVSRYSRTLVHPSTFEFDGLIISRKAGDRYWAAYSGAHDIDRDPYAAPFVRGERRRPSHRHWLYLADVTCSAMKGALMPPDSEKRVGKLTRCASPASPMASSISASLLATQAFEKIGSWLRANFSLLQSTIQLEPNTAAFRRCPGGVRRRRGLSMRSSAATSQRA